nr:hypothetical protein [Nonomuraea cavernae]
MLSSLRSAAVGGGRREQLGQIINAGQQHGHHQSRHGRDRDAAGMRRAELPAGGDQAGDRGRQQHSVAYEVAAGERRRRRAETPAGRADTTAQGGRDGDAETGQQHDGEGEAGPRGVRHCDQQGRRRLRDDDHQCGCSGDGITYPTRPYGAGEDARGGGELAERRATAHLTPCRQRENESHETGAADRRIVHCVQQQAAL